MIQMYIKNIFTKHIFYIILNKNIGYCLFDLFSLYLWCILKNIPMKKTILYLTLFVFLISCQKEQPTPDAYQPITVPPYIGPTTTPQTVVGQTWVITKYRIGQYGEITPLNDTLTFINNTTYHYNSYASTYSFYSTGSAYNLTMNYTPFGNLSGNVNDNNIVNGSIIGSKFIDISIGSSSTTEYYLWMEKL